MKEEEHIIKQEENQFYIPGFIVPFGLTQVTNEIDHYKTTIRHLIEENHYLRKQLKINSDFKIIALSRQQLEDEIFKMIDFLMNNLNSSPKDQIFAYQKSIPQCIQKRTLKYIFFQIFTRYLQAAKTKEEMVKFIIRKSIKYQKNAQNQILMEKQNTKKMNTAFVQQLFKSEEFSKNYQQFLNQYLTIAQNENQQKIRKYCHFIIDQIENNTYLEQILKYKRFPWLNDWIYQSKQIALELQQNTIKQECKKKVKI